MRVVYEFKDPDWTLVWAQPGEPSAELKAQYGAVYHGDQGHITVTLGDGAGTATDPKAIGYQAPWNGAKILERRTPMERWLLGGR